MLNIPRIFVPASPASLIVLCAVGDGIDVRCDKILLFAYADDEGRASACADELVWVVCTNDGKTKGAFNVLESFSNRFEEAIFVLIFWFLTIVISDEVAERFGVGFRGESIALSLKIGFYLKVVFDNTVVDECDFAVAT